MFQIDAIYESGVFRPVEPIDLPERTRVQIDLPATAKRVQPDVREILSRRYASGSTDTAARHDEHQP